MAEWPDVALGDLVDIKHGFAFQGEFFRDDPPGDVLLTPGNFAIGGGFKGDKLKYYVGLVPEEYVLSAGDLIVTMTDLSKEGDTLGYPAIVPSSSDRFLHNQRIGKVLGLGSRADMRFLYYLLCTREYRNEVLASATGTTVKHTAPSRITAFRLALPPLPTQQGIAEILRALDDKIELNRRMNQTLESMARAIFRSWFVDFDPVVAKAEGRQPFGMSADVAALFPSALIRSQAGQIPSGWSTVNVGSVTEIKRQGINPGEFPNESFDHYSIPAFDESRMPKRESGASIKSNKFIVPPQTVLLSKLNPRFPRVWLPEIDSIHRPVCSTEFIVSEPKPGVSREFMYCLFGSLAFAESFSGLVTGTSGSHQRVKPEDLLHMKVIQPPQALTAHFAQLVGPMLKRNSALTEESITLSRMRDTLLPKLMSGELRIRDAEKLVGTHV